MVSAFVAECEAERAGIAGAIRRPLASNAGRIPAVGEQVHEVLRRVGGANTQLDESQVFNLLQSLLWLSCTDACPACIERRQPFQELARPSRALLRSLLDLDANPIKYLSAGWRERVRDTLTAQYHAQISCEQAQLVAYKRDLLALLAEPLAIGFQLFYPVIERMARNGRQWLVELTITEMAQH